MVKHFGRAQPPDSYTLPNSTVAEVDDALIVLRDSDDALLRRCVFSVLRGALRMLVAERMATLRPLPFGMTDPLGQQIIYPESVRPHRHHGNALVLQCGGPPEFHEMTQWLIESFRSHGNAPDVLIVVFCADDGAWQFFRNRTDVLPIRTHLIAKPRSWMKTVVYSAPELVNADYFLCLESDMLVRGDVSEVWRAMRAANHQTIFGAKVQFGNEFLSLNDVLSGVGMLPEDLEWATELNRAVCGNLYMPFNGGALGGHRDAIKALNNRMHSFYPFSRLFCEGGTVAYVDEICTMAAIANAGYISHLAPGFNAHSWLFDPVLNAEGEIAFPDHHPDARIMHYVADAKQKFMPTMRQMMGRHPIQKNRHEH